MTLGLLDRMEAGVAGSRNSSAFQLIRLTTKCALCKECHQLESSHSFNSLGLVPGKLLEAMIKALLLLVTQPDQNKRTMKPQPKTPPECTCFCKQCTRWCFSLLTSALKGNTYAESTSKLHTFSSTPCSTPLQAARSAILAPT